MSLSKASRPEEVRSEWVKELRGENYPQGRVYLECQGKWCCLGVLDDLAVKAGVIPEPRAIQDRAPDPNSSDMVVVSMYGDSQYHLSDTVREWAGINEGCGLEFLANLEDLNDNGKPFKDIANIIEGERAAYE